MKNYSSVQKKLSGEINALFMDLPESKIMEASNQRSNGILDAKYEKANINGYVANSCEEISNTQKKLLLQLLTKYEPLFDGTLGKWKRKAFSLRVKPNAKLSSSVPFSVPHIHRDTLKKRG